MENKVVLHICGLEIGHKGRRLYKSINLDVREGECIMLCGANGSGKTTLLKAISCMNGRGSSEVVMIPARIPKVKGFTLKEFIRLSCFRQSDAGGRLAPEDEATMLRAMSDLGLESHAAQDISTLSDGEFQKAGIAAALVRKAAVIMLDEPTAFLDAENRAAVLKTLKELTRTGSRPAVIFSTHDLYDGTAAADRVIALGADGEVHVSDESKDSKESAVRTIFSSTRNLTL